MADTQTTPLNQIRPRVKGMLAGLTLQFILGMLTNLFAVPPDDPGYASESIIIKAVFYLHGLIALGLLLGAAALMVFSNRSQNKTGQQAAQYGLISIVIAIGGGLATVLLKDTASEVASFIMALGFLGAFASYGYFYSRLSLP